MRPSARLRTYKHLPQRPIPRLAVVVSLVAGSFIATSVASPPASAAGGWRVSARRAVPRNCFDSLVAGQPGVDVIDTTADATGLVRAGLQSSGDWDLAVFNADTGNLVTASAAFGGNELAEGFVQAGDKLRVQACRYAGRGRNADVTVEVLATAPAPAGQVTQVVRVAVAGTADRHRLEHMGLDLTEHADGGSVEVIATGADDLAAIEGAGYTYQVEIPDLAARMEANRQTDIAYAAATERSPLPSGRTAYRHLYNYQYEMKELARAHPDLVRTLTLNHRSVDGRDVNGIEIATTPNNLADGKPVFLNMGVHHAREWPAGEHPMEWAYALIQGYGTDQRTTNLVDVTRNIVIPIVNVDGFNVSREAAPLGDFSLLDYEMKRKNCSAADAPPEARGGVCADNPGGRLRGTDPNRNYAGFWGGPGASTLWSSDTYRGPAPFSEPETQNIRELVSSRQVTNLITNHTYSNLILRAPGVLDTRPPLDEPAYAALGASMAAKNSYSNQPGWQLYDTTGSTEDWTFWNTAGLGFTFEIGPNEFHPPFQDGVVAEYLGLAPAAGAGQGGNREAYFTMLEATASATLHSTITGTAPKGFVLRAHKEFQTPTSPVRQDDAGTVVGPPLSITDVLDSTFKTTGGNFSWAVNPSTRPYVAGRFGRDPQAPKQADAALANPPGEPVENTGDPLTGPHEEVPFTVHGLPEADNGRLQVSISWTDPNTDWDLYLVNAAGVVVGQSATFGTNREDALMVDPPAGEYRAILVNFDQIDGQPFDDWTTGGLAFSSPLPTTIGVREAWTITCETARGRLRAVRSVIVDRGESVDVGDLCRRRLHDVKDDDNEAKQLAPEAEAVAGSG